MLCYNQISLVQRLRVTLSMSKTKARTSKSKQASLRFPVARIHKILRKGNFAPRVGDGAAVFLTAALEYLITEILDLASDAAAQNEKARIKPRHILLAIKNDDELSYLIQGGTISQGGVLPCIMPELLPKKTMKANKANQESQELN